MLDNTGHYCYCFDESYADKLRRKLASPPDWDDAKWRAFDEHLKTCIEAAVRNSATMLRIGMRTTLTVAPVGADAAPITMVMAEIWRDVDPTNGYLRSLGIRRAHSSDYSWPSTEFSSSKEPIDNVKRFAEPGSEYVVLGISDDWHESIYTSRKDNADNGWGERATLYEHGTITEINDR